MRGLLSQRIIGALVITQIISIFVYDILTDWDEVSVAFFYLAPMVTSFLSNSLTIPVAAGILSTILIIIGSFIPLPSGDELIILLTNRAIGIFALGLCVLVMYYRLSSERALRRLVEEEKRRSAVQRAWIATISHEFRSPLNVIDGHAQYVLTFGGETATWATPRMAAIRNAVRRILGLIDGILSSEQAEHDMTAPQLRPIDIGALLTDLCRKCRDGSSAHRITFSEAAPPSSVLADPRLLQYVFDNLLSNACKYSPTDPDIEVAVRSDDGFVIVTVTDHGIGIPDQEIGQVFQRYFRASNARTIPGNGIGLYLAQTIVAGHGGTLSVDSMLERGTTVTVRLPLAAESDRGTQP